jgi:hypothetical protein
MPKGVARGRVHQATLYQQCSTLAQAMVWTLPWQDALTLGCRLYLRFVFVPASAAAASACFSLASGPDSSLLRASRVAGWWSGMTRRRSLDCPRASAMALCSFCIPPCQYMYKIKSATGTTCWIKKRQARVGGDLLFDGRAGRRERS